MSLRAAAAVILLVLFASVAAIACKDVLRDYEDEAVPEFREDQATFISREGGPIIELTPRVDSCADAKDPGEVVMNQHQTVRGTITGSETVTDSQGQVVLLQMAAEGGDVAFAVGIPERALDNFREGPGEYLVGEEVCIAGVVQEYQDTPTIFVTLPAEIVLPFGGAE